jgi:hypothetical protein
VIATEWARAWPVPAEGGGAVVLFYPMSGTPATGVSIASPAGRALLDAGLRTIDCRLLTENLRQLGTRRWSAQAEALTPSDFDRRGAELLDDTESVMRLYAVGQKDPALAARYAAEFKLLAEPDLMPDYYRANPAFWDWLRGVAGDSIPEAPPQGR